MIFSFFLFRSKPLIQISVIIIYQINKMRLNSNCSSRLLTLVVAFVFYLNTTISQIIESAQGSQSFPPFDKFVQKFDKHYESQAEYLKRQGIYISNIEYIKSSNCTYCGVNFYADWTQTQLSGLRTVKESSTKQKIGAFQTIPMNFRERRLQGQLPQTFDWRNVSKFTPIKNEGLCGASWAFSTVAFFQQESIMAGIANQTLDLSEMYLLVCNPENQGCNAGQIQSSIDKVINNRGIPLESLYTFNPSASVPFNICMTTNFSTVPNVSRVSYYQIYDPQTIKKMIFKKPVIAAVCGIDLSFYFPSSNSTAGRTLRCKPQNRILDHSVLLIGYTETQWIVKNHWGPNWGINGYAYISRNPSEDCCIGEQLHTSGSITANCSVQFCQTCVDTYTCYQCEPGKWVKHNTSTGVQTCELCNQENCSQCYNYRGTCKWCADGFGINATINSTSAKCVKITNANCNRISGTLCTVCKPGHSLSSTRTSCNPYCQVKNCNKCVTGPCTECRSGFSLVTQLVNGKNTQFCLVNPCTAANCSLCNSTGQCVACITGFTLQTNATCTTNCTGIAGCISCTSTTSCSICVSPRSYNSTAKTCQIFNGTANCRIHNMVGTNRFCTSCRTGYGLNSSSQCVQVCDSSACQICVFTDISICLSCYSGYYLTNTTINGTTYAGVCIANPCNITNCTLCGPDGVGCVRCATKYLVYNSTLNICQSLCNLTNCRDCMTTGTTAGQCDYCNPSYCIDYTTKQCVTCKIANCLTSFVANNAQYCWACMSNYYLDTNKSNCYIYCTDYYCELCDINSLYSCTKCFDGYFMYLSDGSLRCIYIVPALKGCDFVSYNQTYCYNCAAYYERNNQTGSCQLNTRNCPSFCQYCTTNTSTTLKCKCSSGVYDSSSKSCISSPLNDTDCFIVQPTNGTYYCMECLNKKIVNVNKTGCDSACIVSNCTMCVDGYNNNCWICAQGYFKTSTNRCQQCPFENCKSCKNTIRCFECNAGYELATNQRECVKKSCLQGFIFTGYECICPIGTYYTALSCQPCTQFKCKSCSATKCYSCEIQYYLTSDFKCTRCLTNCKQCTSGQSCDICADGFLYDANTSQCISPSVQGGAFFTNGSNIIQCSFGCLQCDNVGKCTKCSPGFTLLGGFCYNCQGLCKTCQSSDFTLCTSCEDGYFLNSTKCVKCDDTNCSKCTISTTLCETCKEGFYLDDKTCKPCIGPNCLSCNLTGECTKCSPGYGLNSKRRCQQCAANCVNCNGIALNQCLVVCNSTQYQINETCQNCPSKCLSCLSASVCSSCAIGYLLRNGSCKPVCAEGCYDCNQVNPDVCIKCFAGYILSQVGTCSADITCNDNQSCIICPSRWTIVNKKCEICNIEGNCIQCAPGNVQQCSLCEDGFFLNNSLCTACDSSCLKCSSLDRCQLCKDEFLIPKGEVYGTCKPCDSTCKTCFEVPSQCASCREGYELSVTKNCLRLERIKVEIELDTTINNFPTVSDNLKADILKLAGTDPQNGAKYYVITDLREGSVILGFMLAVPEGLDADQTYNGFASQLSGMTQIGGLPLIAVKKVELSKPPKKNSNDTVNPVDPLNPVNPDQLIPVMAEPESINKLAIILGVLIPSVIIILAVLAFTFRRKIFRSKDTAIENISQEVGKHNHSQVLIHVRAKLPSIALHNTSFTPLKDEKINTTGQNRTHFNQTGFSKEQSYSKLEGFNDESRNDFDQTLNNIVEQLNQGYKNQLNMIAEFDHVNEFKEDLSVIKGSQRGLMDNKGVLHKINNELIDEIDINTDTLRKMYQFQQQSPSENIVQVKGGDKSILQIIEFENQPLQDL